MIIRVVFNRDGHPYGRAYAYYSNEEVAVGDEVQIYGVTTGTVTEVNVPEEEIEPFKSAMKAIMGKVEVEVK